MKARKTTELSSILEKKGFALDPKKDHHRFYYLIVDGKKHNIYTYLSHGNKEYSSSLMSVIKKQLKFTDSKLAEDFFDCPMSYQDYKDMLKKAGLL